MHLVTSDTMRALEAAADAAGLTYAEMMRRAGERVAGAVTDVLDDTGNVVVLCGPGNNGGDGLVAADRLAEAGFTISALVWRRAEDDPLIAALVRHADALVLPSDAPGAMDQLSVWLGDADIIVDALLGTGANRPLGGPLADILDAAAAAADEPDGPVVVAVDLPTGLGADDGTLDPHTVPADVTVTFGFPKVGQFTFPGAAAVGELIVDDIGIPEALGDSVEALLGGAAGGGSAGPGRLAVSTAGEVAALLPPRPLDAHKGTFGRALVVAGSASFAGAACLAAEAAYRSGAGLVTVAVPASLQPVVIARLCEATVLPLPEERGVIAPAAATAVRAAWASYDAVLIGPGLTQEPPVQAFFEDLLAGLAGGGDRPGRLIVDADGLNLVARMAGGPACLPQGTVLTPHPGEMARLTGRPAGEINAGRVAVARAAAASWGHVVVLKGAFTVIAAPDGRVTVNPFANPALATAGTGDVLAGLIAGLSAQGMAAFDAAVAAAHLHGLAGELAGEAIGPRGVLAGDVLARVAEACGVIERDV